MSQRKTADGGEIELTVALNRSSLDARRGVARIHPAVLRALGLGAWDALELVGRRSTGVLVGPSGESEGIILLDEPSCANARVSEGDRVVVRRAEVSPATVVEISGLPGDAIEPELLRLALLGKVMAPGDRVGLLPQDYFIGDEIQRGFDRLLMSLQTRIGAGWQHVTALVSAAAPGGLVRVTIETQVVAGGKETMGSATPIGQREGATADELPGLEDEFNRLRELFDMAFNRPEVMLKLGIAPRLGVMIAGPPGSGKGALVAAVATAVGARTIRKWGPALERSDPRAAAADLAGAVEEAVAGGPSIVVIEDVEAIAPKSEAGPLSSVLQELIPSALESGRVAIVCTTAHPERAAAELRRAGMLEHLIEIPLPHREERRRILEIHTRRSPLAPDVKLDEIAGRTPGFVAADLISLTREAALRAAFRAARSGPPFIAQGDFEGALEVVRPSTMDGVSLEIADVSMDDVGDMEAVKQELTEAVVWPLTYADTFDRMGVEPSKGVLLFGPPGCGKTFVVKAFAKQAHANFFAVKGAELLSKWVGESERGVRELFARARGAAPALIFFDEIDALAPVRGAGSDSDVTERVVAALLTELDGIEDLTGVVAVGATNRPDLVDPALLRPGRLERLVFVPPPDAAARAEILMAITRSMPLEDGLDMAELAARCDNFSAADLEGLARRAALTAMRESMATPKIAAAHFERALSECSPSLRAGDVRRLEAFAAGDRG